MFEVTVEETFAAAHQLREYKGKCENLHGHNYRVRITVAAEELDRTGLVVDFVELKRHMRAVVERLDHTFLNEAPPFDVLNPSAENLAKYFYDEMPPSLKSGRARIAAVKIWETDTSTATYRPSAI
jgi:6-pyruvoyltetrahydropterin/6-carboxytetrahydropterin synthase